MSKGKELRQIFNDIHLTIGETITYGVADSLESDAIKKIENLFKDHIPKDEVMRAIDEVAYGETIPTPTIKQLEENNGRYNVLPDGSIESVDVVAYVKELKSAVLKIGTKEKP